MLPTHRPSSASALLRGLATRMTSIAASCSSDAFIRPGRFKHQSILRTRSNPFVSIDFGKAMASLPFACLLPRCGRSRVAAWLWSASAASRTITIFHWSYQTTKNLAESWLDTSSRLAFETSPTGVIRLDATLELADEGSNKNSNSPMCTAIS